MEVYAVKNARKLKVVAARLEINNDRLVPGVKQTIAESHPKDDVLPIAVIDQKFSSGRSGALTA